MSFAATQLLTGLAGASTLFLVASGLTVIFGVTRVVNFAHGSLFMLGSYIAWSILRVLPRTPEGFALGVLAAATAVAIIGVLLEMSLLRRLYRAPDLLQLLATFGVALIVQDLVQRIWGPADLTLPRPPWLRSAVMLSGSRFPAYDLGIVCAGPALLVMLWLLFRRTRFGVLVRAATEDRDMVGALGVDERTLFTAVFAVGAGLAGLAGALALPDSSANLQADLNVVTDAFVVVVVGGLGSLPGAFLASALIGMMQAFGVALLPRLTQVLVFAAMAVILAVRPRGLLGRARRDDPAPGAPPLVTRAPIALRIAGLAALVLAVAVPLFAGPFALAMMTEAAVAVLFAASLHFVMGPGGMPSFGHAAWFGLGAYGAGLAATALGAPMLAGLAVAPIVAGVVALLLGTFVIRSSGVYLAMLTFAFAQIVWAVAVQWTSLTGGDDGILGVWPDAWARDPRVFYWLALALCLGVTLLLRRTLYAPFGYALRATRDAPLRAAVIGIPSVRVRLTAFALAGAAAGLAGGVGAYSKGSIFPTYVSVGHSVDALVMVLLGGVGTMSGPIVGAVVYTGLMDGLLLATDYWRLVLGAAMVALAVAFPAGLAGVLPARMRA